VSNAFRFIKGPLTLSGRERVSAPPGEVIVLEARNGVVALRPGQRMTRGESRFARGQYWRVATRSPEQITSFEAKSSVSRNEFRIELHYFVEVVDPIQFYANSSLEVDPLVDVQLRVRNHVRALAAQTDPAHHAALQAAIPDRAFGLPDYLTARFPEVLVELTEATRSRLEGEAELEERIARRRLQDRLDATNDELDFTSRTRKERNRFNLITMIAEQYKLDVDPLMLRALALDDHPSPQSMHVVRERLLQERYEGLNQFGAFFQALHEHQMLDDEGLAVLMDFARKSTTERLSGPVRSPGGPALPPQGEIDGVRPVESHEIGESE